MARFVSPSGILSRPLFLLLGSAVVAAGLVYLLNRGQHVSHDQGDLVLFCAAGIRKPVEATVADYQREYGVRVQIEPDGSGALLSKLRLANQRADLFLAGEESYIREARALGLVSEAIPAARQHVVLAVRPGNPLAIRGTDDLLRADVSVVVPNPELAAIGRVLKRALENGGQWEALQRRIPAAGAKVSLVGTVNEAAQALKIKAADVAIVWDATARQFDLEFVEVPFFEKRTREQVTLGVVSATARPAAALHFARYLTARDRGQRAFEKYHFQPIPDADVWQDEPALTLMAGAMLKPAIDTLLKQFEQREGAKINTIYAGCGIHVAQMKAMKAGQNPAPHFPDAYFACDVSFMRSVQQWFEASQTITRNDMVIAVAPGNPQHVRSIDDLARPELRLGLAHPVNSALGALTDELLKKLGLRERIYSAARKPPIVHADAGHVLINQLRTGALDATIVYRSNVLSQAEGGQRLMIVEMNLPEAMAVQPYAVAQQSEHKYLMGRLLEAILSGPSRERFEKSGFQWVAEAGTP